MHCLLTDALFQKLEKKCRIAAVIDFLKTSKLAQYEIYQL